MPSPPIIDAHHHFWDPARQAAPWPGMDASPLRRPYGPDDLAPELALEQMTGSVLVTALPSTEESARSLAVAAGVPFVQGVVGCIDLATESVAADLELLRAGPGGSDLVGLCLRLLDERAVDQLSDPALRRGLAVVGAAGLVVDLDLRASALPAAGELCAALPQVRFVLDHLGRPPIAGGDLSAWGRALLPLAELSNVHAKLSGLVTEADWLTWSIDDLRHPVELAVDAFGAHRLMLGSAWPASLVAGSYADVIDSVRYLLADLPTTAQDEIRGGTAVRVYGLPSHGEGRGEG